MVQAVHRAKAKRRSTRKLCKVKRKNSTGKKFRRKYGIKPLKRRSRLSDQTDSHLPMLPYQFESPGNENARNDFLHGPMRSMDIITSIDNIYANEYYPCKIIMKTKGDEAAMKIVTQIIILEIACEWSIEAPVNFGDSYACHLSPSRRSLSRTRTRAVPSLFSPSPSGPSPQ